MKYLITGGCGFLGSNLASEVLARGEELCIFDNLSREGSELNLEWLRSKGEFLLDKGDVRDLGVLDKILNDFTPDVILHLAGQVAMTTSIADPRLDFEINALGTFNLLESVRRNCPESIVIYSSTNKVYGDLEYLEYKEEPTRYICEERPEGLGEDTTLEFHSPYGCSKGAADQYMLDYARIFGLNTVVFRHSSMYGGRQFSTYDQGWVGWFCQKALEIKCETLKESFTISGNGKQVRDVLHAEDMKRLYFAAIDNIKDARGQAFNIGGGIDNSLSLLELFALLEEILDIKMVYDILPPRRSDQKIFVADLDKVQKLLKWKPQVSARQGIEKMLAWLGEEVKG